MATVGALLMILTGVAIMGFGLFIFYAFLPILYALVGFDIGMLIGSWMMGDTGWLAIILGIVGAILLGGASYFLEPFRRILIGVSGGVLVGFALAALLGLDNTAGGILAAVLAVVLGILGGQVVPRVFDTFIIVASAIGGAAMIMNGAHALLPGLGLLDRASGRVLPAVITAGLAMAGIVWQMSNIMKWLVAMGLIDHLPKDGADRSKA